MFKRDMTQDLIVQAAKRATLDGYDLVHFLDMAYWAAAEAIKDGYIFYDYFDYREILESEMEQDISPEERERLVRAAFSKNGLSYNKMLADHERTEREREDSLKNSGFPFDGSVEEIFNWVLSCGSSEDFDSKGNELKGSSDN